jgi:hypothetical protein
MLLFALLFVTLSSANFCRTGLTGYSDTKCKIMKNGEESYCVPRSQRPAWYRRMSREAREQIDIRVDLEMVPVVDGHHAAGVNNACCLKRTSRMPEGEYKVLCKQTSRRRFQRDSEEAEEEEEEEEETVRPRVRSKGVSSAWLRRKMAGGTEAILGPFSLTQKQREGNDILGWDKWETVTNRNRTSNVAPRTGGSKTALSDPMYLKLYIKNNKLWATFITIHKARKGRPFRQGSSSGISGWTRKRICTPSTTKHAELTVGSDEKVMIKQIYQVQLASHWSSDGSDSTNCGYFEFGRNGIDIPFTGKITEKGVNFKSAVYPFRTTEGNNGEYQAFIKGDF